MRGIKRSGKRRLSHRRVRAFDLFSGAGGSSLGARMAGAKILGGVEKWDLASRTYKENFHGAKVYTKNIRSLRPDQVAKKIGRVDLLLASPECTNHTVAKGKGYGRKAAEASRRTAFEVVRFARALKPRWIIVENVIQMRRWKRYQTWLTLIRTLGYQVSEQVLDSADFAVRQTRRRLFVICDNKIAPPDVVSIRSRPLSIRPVLNMNGAYNYSLLRARGRAEPTLLRADRAISRLGRRKPFLIVYYGSDGAGGWQRLGSPLRTITTVDRFALVKWVSPRYRMRMLQIPELRSAMGIPESFRMNHGSRRDKIAMLGNGVCPPVMQAIVRTLLQADKPIPPSKLRTAPVVLAGEGRSS